jgi:hypothetical protein
MVARKRVPICTRVSTGDKGQDPIRQLRPLGTMPHAEASRAWANMSITSVAHRTTVPNTGHCRSQQMSQRLGIGYSRAWNGVQRSP